MAHFAPVAPVQILQSLVDKWSYNGRPSFGAYHLFLAHHTIERKEEFQELIRSYYKPRMGFYAHPMTIIMDNSIVELGGSVPVAIMEEAVLTLKNATELRMNIVAVLPDVMGDGVDTRAVASEAYDEWNTTLHQHANLMLVTQGSNWDDFCATVDYFLIQHRERYKDINWVGIPRYLIKTVGSRRDAIAYVRAIAPSIKIHLLGFSDDIFDDIQCARMGGVTGIDSAVPVRATSIITPASTPKEIGQRQPDWFEKGTLNYSYALQNIYNTRMWVGD